MIDRDDTLRSYVRAYLHRRDVTQSYVASLLQQLEAFDAWHGRPVRFRELDDNLANAWLLHLQRTCKYSPRTIHHYRASLLTVWWAAYQDRMADVAPRCVRRVKVPRQPPQCWTITEVRELLAATTQLEGRVPHTRIFRADWYHLFIHLAWCTGLRLGDLLALRGSQIDADGFLRLSQRKTGEPLTLRLSTPCVARARLSGDGLLLPWPGARRQVLLWFGKLVQIAGVRRGTTRWLRRSAASYVEMDNPGSARLLLGHRTAGLAERHYLDQAIVGRVPPSPPEL